tara:strand:- start:87 stop:590 length:504 start_codon:yes stop_codon:yes gene_type:complete
MGRSVEQMKTLISDANRKIIDLEAQVAKAVEYKLNLLMQFTEVIGESTIAPADVESGVVVEQSKDDINTESLIGFTGHGLKDKPTKEDILRDAETDEDGNLILERDDEEIREVDDEAIMAVAKAEAAKVAEAKAKTIDDHTDENEPATGPIETGLNNAETGKPEGVE